MRTCSGLRPVTLATTACVTPGICVPTQMSQPSLRHLHGAVHRLHRRVREERLLVDGLDLLRGLADGRGGVAVVTRDRAGLLRGGGELRDDVGGRELRVRARVPLRIGSGEALLGGPGVDRDDGDRVVQAHDLR